MVAGIVYVFACKFNYEKPIIVTMKRNEKEAMQKQSKYYEGEKRVVPLSGKLSVTDFVPTHSNTSTSQIFKAYPAFFKNTVTY